jgi:hypothetical protein
MVEKLIFVYIIVTSSIFGYYFLKVHFNNISKIQSDTVKKVTKQ